MGTTGSRVQPDGRHAGRNKPPAWRPYAWLLAVLLVLAVGVAVAIKHLGTTASGNSQNDVASPQSPLPSWAIGPFERYSHNPVLAPPVVPTATTEWEWPELFNPGVVVVDGVFHMLYRGDDFSGISSIGAATSTDGYHFSPVSTSPVIPHTLPSENQGVEDPRLYYLAGKYYSLFTGDGGATPGANISINEAVSSDGRQWQQLGPVIDNTKDPAVVADPEGRPVRIGGQYLMYYGQMGGTYLAESQDFIHWKTVGAVDTRLPSSYGATELCVAVTDYRTSADGKSQAGIDLFVAGNLMGQGRWYYAISEIYFNLAHPMVAAALLKTPVLYPQAPYELFGHTPSTVFMNTIIFYQGEWWMYYGAGDSVVALAQAKLR